jgi:hypothetical protein
MAYLFVRDGDVSLKHAFVQGQRETACGQDTANWTVEFVEYDPDDPEACTVCNRWIRA